VDQDILEDHKDLPDLLDHRQDPVVPVAIQDQAGHLQDIQVDNLKDQVDRKVQVAIQVQVYLVVQVDLVDILVVDLAAHHSPRRENLVQVRHSHRKALQSQIVSICRRGPDNREAKRSSRYLMTIFTVINAG